MARFGSARQLASRAGMCPGNHASRRPAQWEDEAGQPLASVSSSCRFDAAARVKRRRVALGAGSLAVSFKSRPRTRRSRIVGAIAASAIAFVGLIGVTSVQAANRWETYHWPQNAGGGLTRWVAYHDHTDPNVFGTWFRHTMTHYYDANNRWSPYRVSESTPAPMAGYSDSYGLGWPGLTVITQRSGSHMVTVEIFFEETGAGNLTDNQVHHLMCQEDGHGGGLDHRTTAVSCMYQNITPGIPDFDGHDTTTLYDAYGHSD